MSEHRPYWSRDLAYLMPRLRGCFEKGQNPPELTEELCRELFAALEFVAAEQSATAFEEWKRRMWDQPLPGEAEVFRNGARHFADWWASQARKAKDPGQAAHVQGMLDIWDGHLRQWVADEEERRMPAPEPKGNPEDA